MAQEEINPHHLFTIGKGVRSAIEVSIAVNGYTHEWTPAIELALVLHEFDKGVRGRYGDIKALVVFVRFGGSNPTSLIGLEREIPRLVERTCDVVVDDRCRSCGGRDERRRSSKGKRIRVRNTRDTGQRTGRCIAILGRVLVVVAIVLLLLLFLFDSKVVETNIVGI